jgi:hypothetical protein
MRRYVRVRSGHLGGSISAPPTLEADADRLCLELACQVRWMVEAVELQDEQRRYKASRGRA